MHFFSALPWNLVLDLGFDCFCSVMTRKGTVEFVSSPPYLLFQLPNNSLAIASRKVLMVQLRFPWFHVMMVFISASSFLSVTGINSLSYVPCDCPKDSNPWKLDSMLS